MCVGGGGLWGGEGWGGGGVVCLFLGLLNTSRS